MRDKILDKIKISSKDTRENGCLSKDYIRIKSKRTRINIQKLLNFEHSISGISFVKRVSPSETLVSGITVDRDFTGEIEKYIQYDFDGQSKFTEKEELSNNALFDFPAFSDNKGKLLSVLSKIYISVNGEICEDVLILNKSLLWIKFLDVSFLDILLNDEIEFLSYQSFEDMGSKPDNFEIENGKDVETSINKIREDLENLNTFKKLDLILELKSENSQVRIPILGSKVCEMVGDDYFLKYQDVFDRENLRSLTKNNYSSDLIFKRIHANNYKFAAFVSLLEHDEKFTVTWHEN